MPSMRVPLEAWVNARQPVLSAHRKLQVPFRLLLCFQFPTRECLPGRAGRHRYGCRTMLLPRRGGLGASSVCREGRQRASVVVEVEHLAGKGRQGMARSLLACLASKERTGCDRHRFPGRNDAAEDTPGTRPQRAEKQGREKVLPCSNTFPAREKRKPEQRGRANEKYQKAISKEAPSNFTLRRASLGAGEPASSPHAHRALRGRRAETRRHGNAFPHSLLPTNSSTARLIQRTQKGIPLVFRAGINSASNIIPGGLPQRPLRPTRLPLPSSGEQDRRRGKHSCGGCLHPALRASFYTILEPRQGAPLRSRLHIHADETAYHRKQRGTLRFTLPLLDRCHRTLHPR